MRILHLDSSIQGEGSASRILTKSIVSGLIASHAGVTVIYRDLVDDEISHLNGPIAAGFRPLDFDVKDDATRKEHARTAELVSELIATHVLVIGAPMYNFSVASQLKAWIDRVIQPGKTFRYTETGPIGLLSDKKVLIVSTRGGSYLNGPMAQMDFQESYLRAALGFLGIKDVTFLRAENMSRGVDARRHSLEQALASAGSLVAQFKAD